MNILTYEQNNIKTSVEKIQKRKKSEAFVRSINTANNGYIFRIVLFKLIYLLMNSGESTKNSHEETSCQKEPLSKAPTQNKILFI